MKENQNLFDITLTLLEKIKEVIENSKPDLVLVHGDTTTAFVSTLASFYLKVNVGHIEAGLRTFDINSPFPEEFNRQAIGLIANLHFVPTTLSRKNLLKEGKSTESIYVTGNTAIDTLKYTIDSNYHNEILNWLGNDKLIILTIHRRENLGVPMENTFRAINEIIKMHIDVKFVFPIHMNPKIRLLANTILEKSDRMKIIEPLDVYHFHNLINKSFFIITDSGGIQEEAPSLKKPVLVVRETTERLEALKSGTVKLIGTNKNDIFYWINKMLTDDYFYKSFLVKKNPYGDGEASKKIVKALEKELK